MDAEWKKEVGDLIRVRTCGWSPPGDHPVGCGMFIYTDKDGKKCEMWVERLLISIGRVPFTASLDAPVVGLKLDERGFVEVDEECRTNLPNVWAIGDLVKGPMLAHKAEEEGVAVA